MKNQKIAVIWLSLIILISLIVIIVEIAPRVEAPSTLYVGGAGGGNYSKIQWAIDNASDGDTVFVFNGTYYENVFVNKTINLNGIHQNNTTIDSNASGNVVRITVNHVNITGFTITGSGPNSDDAGIKLDNVQNCQIYNNNIFLNNNHGIGLYSSSYNNILENNVTSNSENGIHLKLSSVNNISGNNVSSNGWDGILLSSSNGNNLTGNTVISNEWDGIYIALSNNNFLFYNNVSMNRYFGIRIGNSIGLYVTGNNMFKDGIVIQGNQIEYWNSHNIDISNKVDGKPVYYLKNQTGGEAPIGAGQIILANCTNVNVTNQEITNSTIGIELGYSSYNNISGNYLKYNTHTGIKFFYSNWNYIQGNEIISNDHNGIYVTLSENNTIVNNSINSNYEDGIELSGAVNNFIYENNISDNKFGVYISNSHKNEVFNNTFINNYECIDSRSLSSSNNIYRNSMSSSWMGIFMDLSYKALIFENSIQNNTYGIYLLNGATSNKIFHNNVINNSVQAVDWTNKGNYWNNYYPLGGNYWSDYIDNDNFKGPNQDIPGSDGIGDTPYIIDGNSQDKYPLMQPFKSFKNYLILKQGWNLISLPLIQNEQNLTRVFGSIHGLYNAVQWYDITDSNDNWKHHKIGKPIGNDLFNINETQGIWIHITPPGDTIFVYNGTQIMVNQTISIKPGWNLVGYPSLLKRTRMNALNNLDFDTEVDAIWTHNATTQTWKEITASDNFEVGRGYWVHSKVTKTWIVLL